MAEELRRSVPPWRLKEEADKRRQAEAEWSEKCARLEARCAELEKENKAFRIAVVALGASPDKIIDEVR